MDEIAELKVKISNGISAMEATKTSSGRTELIEKLIRFRNLLNSLEAQLAHFKEIQLNMGMD
jgi:hypothetical protein